MKYRGIKKLGKGLYRVRVTRRDRDGRRVERDRVCRGSLADARELQAALEADLDAELHRGTNARMTLTDYARLWIERRASRLKPSTLAKYVNDLEKHILPRLGARWLDELRPSDISAFVASDPGRGYSVVNRLRLMRTIAKDAVADGFAERDFCARVKAPSVVVYTDEEPNLLSIEELDRLIAAIPEQWLDLAYMLALTGLRWGELSGLRWDDIDAEWRTFAVRRGNWKGEVVGPKTSASQRRVPLSPPLPARLRARRARMERAGHPGLARGWVFPTARGTLHRGTPLRAVLQRACRRAGIEIRFTPHGFRRTWNNVARRLADPLVVRAIVGHATEEMTAHYSRIDADEKRALTDAVAERLGEERGRRDGASERLGGDCGARDGACEGPGGDREPLPAGQSPESGPAGGDRGGDPAVEAPTDKPKS